MKKNAQAATEYLIVLAVVVVIALIVVVVLGGIPGIGNNATGRATAAFWDSADIAITNYAISATGTDTIIVKNNMRNQITITDLAINNVDLESGSSTLGVGESKTYSGSVAACTASQSYSYEVSINYTDADIGASYSFDGDGTKLSGTCAN